MNNVHPISAQIPSFVVKNQQLKAIRKSSILVHTAITPIVTTATLIPQTSIRTIVITATTIITTTTEVFQQDLYPE